MGKDTHFERDTLLSVTAWEDQLARLSRRLHNEQPSDAADLLADAKCGVSDEEAFRGCVAGRVSVDTIDFAVESVRCLEEADVSEDVDGSSDRGCMYPGSNMGGE